MTISTTTPVPVIPPYATMLGFTRYVSRTGPAKATFVGGLRRQRERRSGFNPHGQLVKALKADIAFRTGGSYLGGVVDVVKDRWKPLYEALRAGARTYLASLGDPERVDLAQTRDAIATVGPLAVKINPHFGLRYADGRREAVRLHFDEEPPSAEAATAMLHLMARHMDQILPNAEPVLVDLRRGVAHRIDAAARPADVESWLAGEAAAFTAMWAATAAPAA
ncbi:hypothetical protein FHR83_000176 [Actinoplanes campanulatus]|uniref:Uncharacterized protein n=2 Tax=Actinoplanes TaxID=1865 RepID=A0A7W5AAK6_9ACTN|nr:MULTISPECIES: hypothetical protein [Actinoplanes]MBB3092542.1 hypothetical protein [Actinoplanes campanulatus]GGM97311.1 hypothetical protein GCM10010109_01010 [Actinoplanes campanulatus]GID34363.1 hypothetical protein Aca09nite_08690 [Actinoplanes campanulatus]GID45060.1 hypothetical protein Aca07nite_23350 [Actinoplanes capillaceus]